LVLIDWERHMKKDVRKELKRIEMVAINNEITVKEGKHLKVFWKMKDDMEKTRTLRVVLGKTPSCCHWIKNHRRNVIREMRDHDICPDRYTENKLR
jgi:hypothetical protein